MIIEIFKHKFNLKRIIIIIIIIILLLSFTFLFTSCDKEINNNNDEYEESIYIFNYPKKEYSIASLDDFKLDLSDLVVVYSKTNKQNNERKEEVINNYEIKHNEFIYGVNLINITYKDLDISFNVNIKRIEEINNNDDNIQLEKINVFNDLEGIDRFGDKYITIHNRKVNSFDYVLMDIKYATTRTKDTLIIYTMDDFVKTNIYGYEVLLDEYGRVIDKDVNVTMTRKDQMVLSAHGVRVDELKQLNLGDYVVYDNHCLYVYINNDINNNNYTNYYYSNYYYLYYYYYLKINDLIKISSFYKQIEQYDKYNELVKVINEVIAYFEKINFEKLDNPELNFYSEYDELDLYVNNLNINNIIQEIEFNYDNYDNYDNNDLIESSYNALNNDLKYIINEDYNLYLDYTDKLYYGGFRNADTLVYYDNNNYRERNNYGYEIAINKDGIVIDSATLVDIPIDGYVLSGHSSTASLLRKINVGDKVVIDDCGIHFYTKLLSQSLAYYNDNLIFTLDEIKKINKDYNIAFNNICINYLYQYKTLINLLNNINDVNHLYDFVYCKRIINLFEDLINKIYASSIIYNPDSLHGMWYYPFNNYGFDESIEGINETIRRFKTFGINEVFIDIMTSSGCLFDNPLYVTSPIVKEMKYDGYKDYLECFIDLCHKNNIKVTAFTQTFMHYENRMKDNSDYTYQMDFNGNKSRGSVYYLDICNDNITNNLLNMYKILINYDFDNIEYDIIRYSESNLYKYNTATASEIIDNINNIKDPGYTDYAMNDYVNKYNELNNKNYSAYDFKSLIVNNKDFRINWLIYKENKLIDFITKASALINEKGITTSAAILKNYDVTKNGYLQDYKKWANLGIVNKFEVMNYKSDIDSFRRTNEYYLSDDNEYKDLIRIGISNQLESNKLHGDNLLYDLIQMNDCMNCGYVIYSNNLYLYNDKFLYLMSLIQK